MTTDSGLGAPSADSTAAPAEPMSVPSQPLSERPAWKTRADPKRALELEVSYAVDGDGDLASVTSFQLQPRLFFWRRIALGTRFAIVPILGEHAFAGYELDGYLAYQHFLSERTVPFGRILVGAASRGEGSRANYGGEIGLKLYASRGFYGVIAAGATRQTHGYALAGVGFGLQTGPGSGDARAALFVPIVVGLVAALVPWGIDRAVN